MLTNEGKALNLWYARAKELEEALKMFTDQKTSITPKGEMLRMYGKDGCNTFICEYDIKTITKAREILKKGIKEQALS